MTSDTPRDQPSDPIAALAALLFPSRQRDYALVPSIPVAGRFPAPREEHTVADIAAHNPLDRLKADPDTFGPDQHIIDTWADAEGTETFIMELDEMSLREVRALAELAVGVANEHDRRANRAHRVAAAVRERLADLSGYREQSSQATEAVTSRGR